MTIRRSFLGANLGTKRTILLSCTIFIAVAPLAGARAAEMAAKAPAPADNGWYFTGDLEGGGLAYIQRPPSGFGRAGPPNFWLTAKTSDSRAKFEEYGEIPSGGFLDYLHLRAGSKDGLYAIDLWAQNVGFNNQSYYLDYSKIGEHYLTIGWDQTPHLISTSAKTIFSGAGSTNLTIDPTLRQNLQNNSQNATAANAAGVTARTNIENFINNAANSLELGTQRDKAMFDYRYTGQPDWEFKVDYSHEHRTGTKALNTNWGSGFGAAPGFPSNIVEAIQPIDETTQFVNATGQYFGTSPWGQKWNTSLKYTGSIYDNSLNYFDMDNPFCITCGSGAGAGPRGPNFLRQSLPPSNSAHALTMTNLLDLPYQSRYTGTLQYNAMFQNDPFVDTATNGLMPAALPALSANAQINTFLSNNVVTTQLDKDLRSTMRYRFYDFDNRTPEMFFPNYVEADSLISAAQRRNLAISYTKQNASLDLNWHPARWLNVGAAYAWENWDRTRRDVNVTNEHTGKLYMDAAVWGDAKARGSVAWSVRRYESYDAADFITAFGINDSQNLEAMRKFDLANRDRLKIESFLDVPIDNFTVVTPNFGLRNDFYPTDVVNQLGVSKDNGWNAGVEVATQFSPRLRLSASYNYEQRREHMADCCGGATGGLIQDNIWASDIRQRFDTYSAALDWQAIPRRLDFRLEYLFARGNEENATTPCASGQNGCTGSGTGVTTTQFPTEKNTFQRFSAIARYWFDPTWVHQMGWQGDVALKLRYTIERNQVDNFAIDNMTPYIPTADQTTDLTGGGRSVFLAEINPNYTAQIVAASVMLKW